MQDRTYLLVALFVAIAAATVVAMLVCQILGVG
jgi:hypothetical protein